MSNSSLGRLEKVDPRSVWLSEASDFTPWLGQEGNLQLLAETIGLDLELEAQEKDVGPFRADLLCKDTATGNWVLIENQLERTDHTHLGQLLTYAAGLQAVTIVWIAHRFTEEHRAALDWLNEMTDDRLNFFGLEFELWRIAGSPVAPKFNIVSKPNDWTKRIAETAKTLQMGQMTEIKQAQLDFWTAFREHLIASKSPLKPPKLGPRYYVCLGVGKTGCVAYAEIPKRGIIGVGLWIEGPQRRSRFRALAHDQTVIDGELGVELEWIKDASKTRSYIVAEEDFNLDDRSSWDERFEWLRVRLEAIDRVFRPRLAALDR